MDPILGCFETEVGCYFIRNNKEYIGLYSTIPGRKKYLKRKKIIAVEMWLVLLAKYVL